MITIKTKEEIKILREGGKKLSSILQRVVKIAKPGVTTMELDQLAEKLIREIGGEPSFKNYKTSSDKMPYPATLCVSVNDEVVHGIPSDKKILKEGDVVGLDIGMKYKNLYTDMAVTVPIGRVSKNSEKLIEITQKSLFEAIKVIKSGKRIGDIGWTIQTLAEKSGFSVVKNLVGHGVGYKAHEFPDVPNFGKKGEGEELAEGVVIAIEPMLNAGTSPIILDEDNWTWRTKDGSVSAHFEHTIAITKKGAIILTE